MDIVKDPVAEPASIALVPGSFNPPTRAHLAVARAALRADDAVLFVLPREFPHKDWSGAPFASRLQMLLQLTAEEPRFGVAVSEGGLYVEMAREARAIWPQARIDLVCGSDAAERIAAWEYGEPGVFSRMLDEVGLLVAPRGSTFAHEHKSVRTLDLDEDCRTISATEVRTRIRTGAEWRELVPPEIHDMVARLYG